MKLPTSFKMRLKLYFFIILVIVAEAGIIFILTGITPVQILGVVLGLAALVAPIATLPKESNTQWPDSWIYDK